MPIAVPEPELDTMVLVLIYLFQALFVVGQIFRTDKGLPGIGIVFQVFSRQIEILHGGFGTFGKVVYKIHQMNERTRRQNLIRGKQLIQCHSVLFWYDFHTINSRSMKIDKAILPKMLFYVKSATI